MTARAVIDASAALALILDQVGGIAVQSRLAAWRRQGTVVLVPSHFWLEVANALLRRGHLPASVTIEAMHRLDEFGLETVDVSRPLALLAVALTERHGLSAYDAAYLALAETVDGSLLTGGAELLAAAGSRGVAVDETDRRLSERRAPFEIEETWPRYRDLSAFLARLRLDARGGASARRTR